MGRHSRKRTRQELDEAPGSQFGMGQTLSRLREDEAPSTGRQDTKRARTSDDTSESEGWQTVERHKSNSRTKSKQNDSKNNYPVIAHSANARLQTHVKISDLQSLALYILADGTAPQWVSVRHHGAIRQVVVLMVPGLERGMFNGDVPLDTPLSNIDTTNGDVQNDTFDSVQAKPESSIKQKTALSPDDYYPVKLQSESLPEPLKPLSDIFSHVWPIKAPGDDKYSRIHSPLHAMLTVHLPKSKELKKMKGPGPSLEGKNWQNKRTPITEYLASMDELLENEYVLHPAFFDSEKDKEDALKARQLANQTVQDGWIDTLVAKLEDGEAPDNEIEQGSVTAGRQIIAVDCEMCKTRTDSFELTRISMVSWNGEVILDELVKPDAEISDYLTAYSGITKEMLEPVTTKLVDIQKRLLELITPRTILVGHSLNSDLAAMKMTHPFIVDTTIIYPHPRGPPLKSSLKWLSQKYLSREIQRSHGSTGHDSIEDARACLDLVKQKCERGPSWGTSEAANESIFKRLGRSLRPLYLKADSNAEEFRTGAVVDWGDPRRGIGSSATVSIGCGSDSEVVKGIKAAINGQVEGDESLSRPIDLIWARFRELEAVRGWWTRSKTADNEELRANAMARGCGDHAGDNGGVVDAPALADAVKNTVGHIREVYESLPPCTALIIYSGTGDPREMARLQAMQQQFKKEYMVKKWDQLSVKWTDTEEQALRKACIKAREGVGFVAVK